MIILLGLALLFMYEITTEKKVKELLSHGPHLIKDDEEEEIVQPRDVDGPRDFAKEGTYKLSRYADGQRPAMADPTIPEVADIDRDMPELNSLDLLPKDNNGFDGWKSVPQEPVSVENRHLINATRVFGVNTINASSKNASHDLRAAPLIEKVIVGPWNQSSFDQDRNLRPLM